MVARWFEVYYLTTKIVQRVGDLTQCRL